MYCLVSRPTTAMDLAIQMDSFDLRCKRILAPCDVSVTMHNKMRILIHKTILLVNNMIGLLKQSGLASLGICAQNSELQIRLPLFSQWLVANLYLVTGKWLIGLRIHLLPLLKILCGWIFYNDLHNIKNYAHRRRFVVFCYCLIHIYLSISFRGEPRVPLLWRHNGLDGVSNHQPHHYLLIPLHPAGADNTTKKTKPCAYIVG